jgi:hypothetical protein
LQLEHQRRLKDVHSNRKTLNAGFLQKPENLLRMPFHQTEIWVNSTAQADESRAHVLRLKPRAIQFVMHSRRAEAPEDRLLAAHQQRPPRKLIALPLTDFGRSQVPDVVDVKDEQRAEFRSIKRFAGTPYPIVMKPPVIDALLEVHGHCTQRGQMPIPVEPRINVCRPDGSQVG